MCSLQVVIKVPQITAAVTWLGWWLCNSSAGSAPSLQESEGTRVFPQTLVVARGGEQSLERDHGAGSACSLCPGSDQKPSPSSQATSQFPIPFAALPCTPSKPAEGQDPLLSWFHQDLPVSYNINFNLKDWEEIGPAGEVQ